MWEKNYKLTAARIADREPPRKARRFDTDAFNASIHPDIAYQDEYDRYVEERVDDIDIQSSGGGTMKQHIHSFRNLHSIC